MYHITQETVADWWEVEALYDLCFAPGRTALSSYRLRDNIEPVPELSLIARDVDHILAGAIRHWPVRIGRDYALLLGPVAVHPTRQGEGLGGSLIRESIQIASNVGWERMLLVGDAPYYARFGFEKLKEVAMPHPTNPDRVLGLALRENAWCDIAGPVEKYEI